MHALLLAVSLTGVFAGEPQTGYWRGQVQDEQLQSIMTYAAKLERESVGAGQRTLRVKKYDSGRQTVNLTFANWRCDMPSFVGCLSGASELRLRIESDGSAMAYSFPGPDLPVEQLAKGALGELMFWSSSARP